MGRGAINNNFCFGKPGIHIAFIQKDIIPAHFFFRQNIVFCNFRMNQRGAGLHGFDGIKDKR